MRWMLCVLLWTGPALAGDDAPCDKSAIRWEFPHAFEAARKRAADEHRILLVKGVSFGIDDVGARCATKGKW